MRKSAFLVMTALCLASASWAEPNLAEKVDALKLATQGLSPRPSSTSIRGAQEGFALREVVIHGLPSDKAYLADLARQTFGASLSGQSLLSGVQKLNEEVRDSGTIASSVTVPDQNIASGTLVLEYQPGKIGHFETGDVPKEQYFTTDSGSELNLRDLEQGLDQYNLLPSRHGRLFLMQGERGATDVVIETQQVAKPTRFTLGWRNGGSPLRGRTTVWGRGVFDDFLGRGDQLTLMASSDARWRGPAGRGDVSLRWMMPWQRHTLAFDANVSWGHHPIRGQNFSFDLHDRAWNIAFTDQWLVHRNQWSKTYLEASLRFHGENSFLGTTELIFQRRRQTFLTVGLNGVALGRKGMFNWRLALKHSTPFLAEVLESDEGSTLFTQLEASVTAALALDKASRWWLTGSLAGQYSPKAQYVGDQFSIGSGVTRGFGPNQALRGERGLSAQVELAYVAKGGFEVYGALDAGLVRGPSVLEEWEKTTLVGGALGLRGRRGRLGWGLAFEKALHGPKEWNYDSHRVTASVTYELD